MTDYITDIKPAEHKSKGLGAFLIFSLIIAAMITLRFLIVLFFVKPDTGFYDISETFRIPFMGTLVRSFDYFAAILVFAAVVAQIVFVKKRRPVIPARGTGTLIFTSSLTAFLLLASAVIYLLDAVSVILLSSSVSLSSYISNGRFEFILFICAIPAAIYFFKIASENPQRRSVSSRSLNLFLACFPIIIAYARLFSCFFNMDARLNSSGHIYELMCQVAIMMYFMTEALMFSGRKVSVSLYSYAFIAVLLISLSSFVNLILSAFWLLSVSEPPLMYAIDCAFALYILSRIYSQIKYGKTPNAAI